jgi:hypothetical protein
MTDKSSKPTPAQLRAENIRAKKSAEKPLKIKGGFDAAMKKIARAPKPKRDK